MPYIQLTKYRHIITGTCYCFDGFVGPDCSQEVTVPPSNISVPQEGLCGTRSRACRRTNIYGIFPTSDVWCKRNHFQVRVIILQIRELLFLCF